MTPDTGARRRRPFGRRFLIEWFAIGCLGLAAVCAGVFGHVTAGLDRLVYDRMLGACHFAPDRDIVVIEIDNASLDRLGRWPWPRSVHAQLLDRLAQAKPAAVIYDVLFAEPSPDDAQLAGSLARVPTWLPMLLGPDNDADGRSVARPVPALAAKAAGVGYVNFEVDPDGIVRGLVLARSDGRRDWPQLTLSAARALLAMHGIDDQRTVSAAAAALLPPADAAASASGLASAAPGTPLAAPSAVLSSDPSNAPSVAAVAHAALPPPGRYLIPFASATPGYAAYPLADVLAGKVRAEALRGKVVLVGVTATSLYDRYVTPFSGHAGPVPGVDLHASVLDMLLTGRAISPLASGWLFAASLLPLGVLLAGILQLSPLRAALLAAVAALLTAAGSAALLFGARVWVSPAPALLGLVIVYPVWNWRRLEMTMSYLRGELERLASEPHLLPEMRRDAAWLDAERERVAGEFGGDVLERQMTLMAQAAQRVQDMKRFVWDSLDSMPEPIFVTDVDGAVLIANHAAKRYCARVRIDAPEGRPLQDALGELAFVKSVAHPEREPALRAAWPAALDPVRGEALAPLESGLEVRDADGLDHLLRYAACTNAHGRAIGWIAGLVDVTALHAAERQREEALHLLSHDMRSPQTSILALVQIERQRGDASAALRELFGRIERHAQRALTLADEFVQLARAESQTYRIDVVNFADLLVDASDEVWPQAQAKRIRIEAAVGGEPHWIGADRSLMARALVNLLSNAVKYSPAGTLVACSFVTGGTPARVTCTIRDQGYGIAPEDQRHLFERFRRFHATERPEITGAGLGMAFVKTVVTRHGGSIAVDSVVGRGTAISISLPRLDEPAE